jgi:polar amino acid transport system substrate-binding protein
MSMDRSRARRYAAGAALFLLAAVGAACGNNSSSTGTTTSTTGSGATTSSTPTPSTTAGGIPAAPLDPTLASEVPAKYKSGLTVAMDATYAPDEFIAPDGHTIIGMDADLAYAIGQVLGVKMNLEQATFATIIPGLLDGKYDVGNSSFTDTKARQQQVDFVTYFSAGEGFYVSASSSSSFNGLASLCGHSVAVESGTTEESDAQSQAKKCHVTVESFQNQNEANLAVSSGRAEVGFLDSQVAAYVVQQSHGQFKLTGTPFSTAPYGIALPKNSGLAQPFLGAIKDLMSDGIYAKILAKWGTTNGAITNPTINGATS